MGSFCCSGGPVKQLVCLAGSCLGWGLAVTPDRGALLVVPRVATLLQREEQGVPVPCSIPTLSGPGGDQSALLEALLCAIWIISPLGLASSTRWLRLPSSPWGSIQAGSKLQGTCSCLGV